MKKILLSATLILAISNLSADPLKNSLMPVAQKETPAVNLDNLNINAKPTKRADDAIVATVNGVDIKKEDADKFLALASKGKVTDMDALPAQQQTALINGMAASVVIEERAKKEITEDIKNKLAASYWAKQEMSKINVDKKDVKAFYEKNKAIYKGQDGNIIDFNKVEQYVEMQLKQQKFNQELMKSAKVIIK